MKKYIVGFLMLATCLIGCKDLEEVNIDPNRPTEVATTTLLSGAQKRMMDYIYDAWFSGRQALPYAQYWSQRNYTEEDRYQVRESVNNNYYDYLYGILGFYQTIIDLNTNPATKAKASAYGNNDNQIAAARIMKAWIFQLMADTWGGLPYSEALDVHANLSPKYDNLEDIYADLIKELSESAAMIVESEPAFVDGDMICGGDATTWKKLANSLKCRVALRTSKVDGQWRSHIASAIASGVMDSNDDNAVYKYSKSSPSECYFYRSFAVDGRNDFSITKPLVDILKGQRDTLNNKTHPWEGTVDPRLSIYATPRNSRYIGIPFGLPSNRMNAAVRNAAPNFYANPPAVCNADFSVMVMTYPELCFILSEYEGFSAAKFEDGVRASLEYWYNLGDVIPGEEVEKYVTAVTTATVNAEAVALQKYIHLYMYGTEAWSEYRRTGYPKQLLRPGEISHEAVYSDVLTKVEFTSLSETKGDIAARVKYPTNESTVNQASFEAAVAKLQDGTNNYYSKMFWDVRTGAYDHPANR